VWWPGAGIEPLSYAAGYTEAQAERETGAEPQHWSPPDRTAVHLLRNSHCLDFAAGVANEHMYFRKHAKSWDGADQRHHSAASAANSRGQVIR
jgi:hypothetical protein